MGKKKREQGDGIQPPGQDDSETSLLLIALHHPTRRELLKRMPSKGSISPRELSNLLDAPLSNVSYHIRILANCGAIKLVATKPVRGSMQHFYRPAIEAEWARAALGLDDQSV